MKINQFLAETKAPTFASWMPQTVEEVKRLADRHFHYGEKHISTVSYSVNKNGTVSFYENVTLGIGRGLIKTDDGVVIAMKMQGANNNFQIDKDDLVSLVGCPDKVGKNFEIWSLKLKSLVGGPKRVTMLYSVKSMVLDSIEGAPQECGSLSIRSPMLTSLAGIHKHVKTIHRNFAMPNTVNESILGILMINELNRLSMTEYFNKDVVNQELARALSIVERHLGGNRDVLACQEELIDNNLDRFAQL